MSCLMLQLLTSDVKTALEMSFFHSAEKFPLGEKHPDKELLSQTICSFSPSLGAGYLNQAYKRFAMLYF